MTQQDEYKLVGVANWIREAQRQTKLAKDKVLCDGKTRAHEHLENAEKNLVRSMDSLEQLLLAQ